MQSMWGYEDESNGVNLVRPCRMPAARRARRFWRRHKPGPDQCLRSAAMGTWHAVREEDDRESAALLRGSLGCRRRRSITVHAGRDGEGPTADLRRPDKCRRFAGHARPAAQRARGYVPGDIKSARGKIGGDDDQPGKPKLHYAVQVALYVDILHRLGHTCSTVPASAARTEGECW